MNWQKALWKASGVFAPNYPRQSSDDTIIQDRRANRREFCEALERACQNQMPGYYSVYSFPRGHSRDGNIPEVDCIFIDLDVEGGRYDPNEGKTDFKDWKVDMSALLARSRMIARAIIDADQTPHFRAVLSGHKGLHLYLDFGAIAPNEGTFQQFKNGLKSYGEQVMAWLDSTAGGVNIDPWVDVDASDLGRLARHPNTIHHGAAYDDETRWCVPVTIEELAEVDIEEYLDLTSEPRWPDGYDRTDSETAHDKVVQHIREATSGGTERSYSGSQFDKGKVKEYENTEGESASRYADSDEFSANEDIEIEDIAFLTANKPCIQAFRERDDAFEYGNSSHVMEISIIARFVEMGVPKDVIHEYFSAIPGYDEAKTEEQINKIIGRQYKEFDCSVIADRAPMFCLGDECAVYRRGDDIQK